MPYNTRSRSRGKEKVKDKTRSNMSVRLQHADLSQQIAFDTGHYLARAGRKWPTPVLQLLRQRENNTLAKVGFQRGEYVSISNRFLPASNTKRLHIGSQIFCSIHSEDGTTLLTASQDGILRVFDPQQSYKMKFLRRCRHVQWSVIDCDYSPNKMHVAYSSWSQFVHLTNMTEGEERHIALDFRPETPYHFCLFSIKFSADGNYLIGGSNELNIYVYDLISGKRTFRIPAHDDDVNSVAFAKSSQSIFYSASDDGLCKIWDCRIFNLHNQNPVGVLRGHSQGLTYVASKSDGRYLITNSKDQTIKLWDIRAMGTNHNIAPGPGTSYDYRMHTWYPTGTARNDPNDMSLMTYKRHRVLRTLIRARFSPLANTGERFIYSGCATGNVIIWDILTGKVVKELQGHQNLVRDVSWHPTDNSIVSSSWDRSLRVWEYREPGDSNVCEDVDWDPWHIYTAPRRIREEDGFDMEDEDYEEEIRLEQVDDSDDEPIFDRLSESGNSDNDNYDALVLDNIF